MKHLILSAIALFLLIVVSGCSSMEIPGVTKPEPRIRAVVMDREASAAVIYTNRVKFTVPEFTVYRMVNAGDDPRDPSKPRRYIQFQFVRTETDGDRGGKAIFILSSHSGEALDMTSTYFILVQVNAQVWDYDDGNGTVTSKISGLYKNAPGDTIYGVMSQVL